MNLYVTIMAVGNDQKRAEYEQIAELCSKNGVRIPRDVQAYLDGPVGTEIHVRPSYPGDGERYEIDLTVLPAGTTKLVVDISA